jgi:hypothetical protein
LRKYGADLKVVNRGSGPTFMMNILHSSIHWTTKDYGLFDYCLEKGFDPNEKSIYQTNLWFSLMKFGIRTCPEERFMVKASQLHKLNISPYERGQRGQRGSYYDMTAEEYLRSQIDAEKIYIPSRIEKLKRFYRIMCNEDYDYIYHMVWCGNTLPKLDRQRRKHIQII